MTYPRFRLRTLFSLTAAVGAVLGWLQLSPWWFPGWWALGGVALCVWATIVCRDLSAAVRWFTAGLFCQYCDAANVLLLCFYYNSCSSDICDLRILEALQSGFSLPVFVVLGTAGFWLQRGDLRTLRDAFGRDSGSGLVWGTASIVTLAITMAEFTAIYNAINASLRQERLLEQQFEKLNSGGSTYSGGEGGILYSLQPRLPLF